MLAAISRALEERDQTQGHGARVAALAEPIVQRLGWDVERIAALHFGALHHDIGKVAVRGDLLRKAGPLTLDELAEIRTHPSKGAELVRPLRAARHALPYVLYHHERWDGDGYPSRLRGNAIPFQARLLAIADAFDAMTSPRPYRHALTHERALLELCSFAGTQFDPAIAELFLEVWSEPADSWPAAAVAS
jgi:HD-GYP domain-containing protein (c-di-GMP phosphodiesterase class II)